MANGTPVSLPIVVIGDSIMWGQGLRPGTVGAPSDKMAELVAATLATDRTVVQGWSGGAGIAVSISRFAHSAATINGQLPPAGTPPPPAPVTATTPFPGGEVPAPPATILDQAAGAPNVIDPAAVRLVLLDGGINDVGLTKFILNPLEGPDTIGVRANAACGGTLTVAGAAALLATGATTGRMTSLLASVGTAFPNAVIVVTGYYDILSLSSDLFGLVITAGFLAGAAVPELLLPGGWLALVLGGAITVTAAAGGIIANCAAFKTTSDTSLRSAVALANAAPGGSFGIQGATAPRFMFIPPPFTPDNALFTHGSNGADEAGPTAPAFLWGINPSLDAMGEEVDAAVTAGSIAGGIVGFLGGIIGAAVGSTVGAVAGAAVAIGTLLPKLTAVDEVVGPRNGACAGFPAGALGSGTLFCHLASVGHPNIEGEAAYAAAIRTPLITMFGTTLPAIGIVGTVGGPPHCLIATAALEYSQVDQVNTLRRLRDEFIAHSRPGQELFAAASREYYAFSPIVAARMRSDAEFRERVRRYAVSPLLGFTQLLGCWTEGSDGAGLQETLAHTLDVSLEDLARDGVAGVRVNSAAEEIARLSVRGPIIPAPGSQAAEVWNTEPHELVDYFNAVMAANVQSDGAYVDGLLLDPLKRYWRLLGQRAAGAPVASIRSQLETEVTEWLAGVSQVAVHAWPTAAQAAVDIASFIHRLGMQPAIDQIFAASLGGHTDGSPCDGPGAYRSAAVEGTRP